MRRNAAAGPYASGPAQQACKHRRRKGRPLRKLHVDSILFGAVEHFMRRHWSPEQIAFALARLYAQGHDYRVSHETIYNCIYAQPVGELRRDLIDCLRQAHNKRVPRSTGRTAAGRSPTC